MQKIFTHKQSKPTHYNNDNSENELHGWYQCIWVTLFDFFHAILTNTRLVHSNVRYDIYMYSYDTQFPAAAISNFSCLLWSKQYHTYIITWCDSFNNTCMSQHEVDAPQNKAIAFPNCPVQCVKLFPMKHVAGQHNAYLSNILFSREMQVAPDNPVRVFVARDAWEHSLYFHYNDVILSAMTSQITSLY